MAKMDYVSCRIMQGGDPGSIIVRNAFSPVSWPEVGLLAMLHGIDSVFDFVKLGEVDSDPQTEKRRLMTKYDAEAVEKFAPGMFPQMVMQMPEGFGETMPETDLSRRERTALRRARMDSEGVMDLPVPGTPKTVAAVAASGAEATGAPATAPEGFAVAAKKREAVKAGEFSKTERFRDEL